MWKAAKSLPMVLSVAVNTNSREKEVLKQCGIGINIDKYLDQWNKKEIPEIDPRIYTWTTDL